MSRTLSRCMWTLVVGLTLATSSLGCGLFGSSEPESLLVAERSEPATWTSEQQAFILGVRTGEMALGHALGSQPLIDDKQEVAQHIADAMGTDLVVRAPSPGPTSDVGQDGAAALHFVLQGDAKTVEAHLAEELGARHAALFRLGTGAPLVALLHVPGDGPDSLSGTLMDGMGASAAEAGVESAVVGSLDVVRSAQDSDLVRAALMVLENDVFEQLSR